ncbi:MAG: HAAS signaling domain-containing protein [Streptosporangiaceae bacterium]
MSRAGHERDPIEEYLDQLRAGLRTGPQEAELILAEAEDHLRETAAAGLAIGMTEREAQEAAISSFGPVRAVVRAHHARRGWLAAAAEAGLAAWKLASILLLTSGVTGLAIATINTIRPPAVLPNNGVCWPCLPSQVLVTINPPWLALTVAAVGGAILLAGCGLTLRLRRRRGRWMLLRGLFPMVAAGFFSTIAIALALTTLNASGVSGPDPGLVPGLTAAAYLALAAGYAIRMARTLRRQRRDQAGTFGRVLGKG